MKTALKVYQAEGIGTQAVLEMVVRALVIARADPDREIFILFDDETVAEYKRVYGDGSWMQICAQLKDQYGLPIEIQ